MNVLNRLKTVTRPSRQIEEKEAAPATDAFEKAFSAAAKKATPEAIEKRAGEERAAAKTTKQRARKKIRTEHLSVRVEPTVKAFLQALAKKNGGKTIADGLHIAVKLLRDKPERGDD